MTDKVVALTTCSSSEEAAVLARGLIERRIAACANILPAIRSVYRWQGKVEEDSEALLIIKTARDSVEALKAAIRQLHPYEVPELIVLPIEAGATAYLEWVGEQVGPQT